MPRCVNHPGRESAAVIHGRAYCAQCQAGIVAARGRVDRHVEPKDCFVWYRANNDWQPITGTGCAHWVAHQRNIQSGGSGERCLAGFTYRVRTLVFGRQQVANLLQVAVNDIYATPSLDHTGLVILVTPPSAQAAPGTPPTIVIRHDSSAQGRVAENEFATYFHGQGQFYR